MKKMLFFLSSFIFLVGCHEGTNNTQADRAPAQGTPESMAYQPRPMDKDRPPRDHHMMERGGMPSAPPMGPPMPGDYPPFAMKGSFHCTFVPDQPPRRANRGAQAPRRGKNWAQEHNGIVPERPPRRDAHHKTAPPHPKHRDGISPSREHRRPVDKKNGLAKVQKKPKKTIAKKRHKKSVAQKKRRVVAKKASVAGHKKGTPKTSVKPKTGNDQQI